MTDFGDYIIYVDESGDHNLSSIDEHYPVFVLSFCVIKKKDYVEKIVPKLKQFKFDIFGHDTVILHEREIRKSSGDFAFLQVPNKRTMFLSKINEFIENAPMTIIATVIKKDHHKKQYTSPDNPYNIALGLCMERAAYFLKEKNQTDRLTHIIAESRGKKEDKDLELEFLRINQGNKTTLNFNTTDVNFEMKFVSKTSNMAGLQLSDLIARPIGRHVMNPKQENRAFNIIEEKIFQPSSGGNRWHGLKIFH